MSTLTELMQDRQFWLEFINEYRTMPVLWKPTHPHYTSRKYRDIALLSLTKKVRKKWPQANVEYIKQRISNFRRTFLNEYEKVMQAKKTQNVYVPSLYYYNHLKFLKDDDELEQSDASENGELPLQTTETSTSSQKTLKFSNDFIKTKEKRLHPFSVAGSKEEIYDETNHRKRSKLLTGNTNSDAVGSVVFHDDNESYDNSVAVEDEEELIESELKTENDFSSIEEKTPEFEPKQIENVFHADEDEFDDIARRVATHFRRMDPEQCLFAEKLIFDVCISGRLKRLTTHTNISNS